MIVFLKTLISHTTQNIQMIQDYLRLRINFLLNLNEQTYIDIDKSEVDYGRFFTEAEDKSLSRVAVLGYKMKEKLFGDSDPIGKSIKIRKTKYRVIGVMEERGAATMPDPGCSSRTV